MKKKVLLPLLGLILVVSSIVIGTLMVSSATGDVGIIVDQKDVSPGEEFSLNVSLSDIPTSGLNVVSFALKYDADALEISSVTAGGITNTGAEEVEEMPCFDYYISGDYINVIWTTGLKDSTKWIKTDGVFAVVTGVVKSGVAEGTYPIEIVPATTSDNIKVGYLGENNLPTVYACVITNGYVKTGEGEGGTEDTGSGTQVTIVYGDVNVDGSPGKLSDVIMLGKYLGGKADLNDQQKLNANCHGDTGLTSNDLIVIVKYSFNEISAADLPIKA